MKQLFVPQKILMLVLFASLALSTSWSSWILGGNHLDLASQAQKTSVQLKKKTNFQKPQTENNNQFVITRITPEQVKIKGHKVVRVSPHPFKVGNEWVVVAVTQKGTIYFSQHKRWPDFYGMAGRFCEKCTSFTQFPAQFNASTFKMRQLMSIVIGIESEHKNNNRSDVADRNNSNSRVRRSCSLTEPPRDECGSYRTDADGLDNAVSCYEDKLSSLVTNDQYVCNRKMSIIDRQKYVLRLVARYKLALKKRALQCASESNGSDSGSGCDYQSMLSDAKNVLQQLQDDFRFRVVQIKWVGRHRRIIRGNLKLRSVERALDAWQELADRVVAQRKQRKEVLHLQATRQRELPLAWKYAFKKYYAQNLYYRRMAPAVAASMAMQETNALVTRDMQAFEYYGNQYKAQAMQADESLRENGLISSSDVTHLEKTDAGIAYLMQNPYAPPGAESQLKTAQSHLNDLFSSWYTGETVGDITTRSLLSYVPNTSLYAGAGVGPNLPFMQGYNNFGFNPGGYVNPLAAGQFSPQFGPTYNPMMAPVP